MENMNQTINTSEHKLQNTLSKINFDKLSEIDANELGRSEIETIVEKMKQSIDDRLSAYLHAGESYCLPLHIELQELDSLLSDPKVDQDEIIDELSLLSIAIVLYSLSQHYKNSLLSSNRNDHHAYMLQTINSFAHQFEGENMIEGRSFDIVRSHCIMDYEIEFLLFWQEFATLDTQEEWIV